MKFKYVFFIFFIFMSYSCTNKTNFKDEMILKSLPSNISSSDEVVGITLKNYATSIKKIDYEKILSSLKNDVERNEFKKNMIDLREAFDKCVDKFKDSQNAKESEKEKIMTELSELKNELDTVWQYIIRNYKI